MANLNGVLKRSVIASRHLLAAALLCGGSLVPASDAPPPAPYQVMNSPLPGGNNGIAARYPDDVGIAKDPAVVFHDDFEPGNLSKWTPGWRAERARITQDAPHTGSRAMQWAVTISKGDDGGNMGAKLAPGLDICFYRVYCRLPENFDVRRMHG